MIYQVDNLVREVRVALDENRTADGLLGAADVDSETLMLDEEIRSKLTEATDRVHLSAPYHLCEQGHRLTGGVFWGDLESGWMLLPDDFLRLVVFEMSDWERPVYELLSNDNPLYKRQSSRFKALRGTSQRPLCFLGVRPEGCVLEFYSCKSEEATVRRAVYIPRASVDENGGLDISEKCHDAVVYTAAGLVLASIGNKEQAAMMFELGKLQ